MNGATVPSASVGLAFADWVIIVVYGLFILGLGYYLKRFTSRQEDLSGLAQAIFEADLLPDHPYIQEMRQALAPTG